MWTYCWLLLDKNKPSRSLCSGQPIPLAYVILSDWKSEAPMDGHQSNGPPEIFWVCDSTCSEYCGRRFVSVPSETDSSGVQADSRERGHAAGQLDCLAYGLTTSGSIMVQRKINPVHNFENPATCSLSRTQKLPQINMDPENNHLLSS